MKNKKLVNVLFSGGLDSTLTLLLLIKANVNIQCIFIDYGQAAVKQEQRAVEKICKMLNVKYKIIVNRDLLVQSMNIGSGKKGARVVKDRNKTLIKLALKQNNPTAIAIGCNLNDYKDYEDCRPEYLQNLSKELNIAILFPLINSSKLEILQRINNYTDIKKLCWSCYESDNDIPCGECNSCLEIKKVFD